MFENWIKSIPTVHISINLCGRSIYTNWDVLICVFNTISPNVLLFSPTSRECIFLLFVLLVPVFCFSYFKCLRISDYECECVCVCAYCENTLGESVNVLCCLFFLVSMRTRMATTSNDEQQRLSVCSSKRSLFLLYCCCCCSFIKQGEEEEISTKRKHKKINEERLCNNLSMYNNYNKNNNVIVVLHVPSYTHSLIHTHAHTLIRR